MRPSADAAAAPRRATLNSAPLGLLVVAGADPFGQPDVMSPWTSDALSLHVLVAHVVRLVV